MTTTSTAVRTLHGTDLPAAGTWTVDPGHAEIGFHGRHFLITTVRGRFTAFDATVEIADHPEDSRVDVTIDMTSVDSGDRTRDDHLRSADLFDVENFPTATFRSTAVTRDGSHGTVTGDLTIRGVTRPVTLDVEFLGGLTDPWGNDRAVFTATGRINREDWGITWNMPLDSGGLLVSREIGLELHVELVRQ